MGLQTKGQTQEPQIPSIFARLRHENEFLSAILLILSECKRAPYRFRPSIHGNKTYSAIPTLARDLFSRLVPVPTIRLESL